MEDSDGIPVLVACKPLKLEFAHLQKIPITSEEFSIGRCLQNSIVIPFLSISRKHCTFKKRKDDEWLVEDNSSFGIRINNEKLGKGSSRVLSDDDVLSLDPSDEFVYKISIPNDFEIPKKRKRMDKYSDSNIINSMKMKFEASQCDEIKHIEEKILNAKQLQTTSLLIKEQLQSHMDRKMQQLQNDFALQIESLKGENNEVEKQKVFLIEERDAQLNTVKDEMEGKISELMEQIQKHNESESELLNENNLLKEKLLKEREEFLSELSRESSSKQDMLEKLEAKVREQEEIRLREKQELQELMSRENEQLRLTKEKELKDLEERKRQREIELEQELSKIKKNLEDQIEQSEQQKQVAEQKLTEQVQEMKKLSDEEKTKMEHLLKEREEIQQKQLSEAQTNAEKSLEELRNRVSERETELAALAAERIQKQAEQSGIVISTLQEQLEKAKSQLQSVETEKNTLLESICFEESTSLASSSTKQSTLNEVGELMESELQCSICAELFIESTTLNCSHTFCKYCISMWKKKKNDCPICRSPIRSECRSLVLDTFIDKMVQNLTEDMKKKRQSILEYRAELVAQQVRNTATGSRRRSDSYDESDAEASFDDASDGAGSEADFWEDELDPDSDEHLWSSYSRRHGYERSDSDASRASDSDELTASDTDSGSDDDADTGRGAGAAAGLAPAAHAAGQPTDGGPDYAAEGRGFGAGASAGAAVASTSNNASGLGQPTGSNNTNNRRRRRGNVPGVPGSYYGGYGRCFSCGARGHWAPGCPFV